MAQLSVVLSGSCPRQYESRRGNAVLSADKEAVDFLVPRQDSRPRRSKVNPSSCVRPSRPVSGNASKAGFKTLQMSPDHLT